MASSSSSSPFSHLPSPPASVGGGGGGGGATSAAVDAIIAEAMDLCALEHIAALNTAHLPRDPALLPSHLESRFRALKSFPAPNNGAPPPLHRTRSAAAAPASPIDPKKDPAVVAGKGSKPDPPSGLSPPPPIAPRSSRRGGVSPSPSPSPSPPRRHTSMCCFAFSPKKASASASAASSPRSGGKGRGGLGIEDWESNERIVAELKEQRRKLKKALQEQAKARSEAAKIVRLAKQASARMSTFAIDDDDELLSDEDEDEEELFK